MSACLPIRRMPVCYTVTIHHDEIQTLIKHGLNTCVTELEHIVPNLETTQLR
jgi:hypothetical protein